MPTVQSKDGTKIEYDVFGSGPALIFTTGAICFRKFGPVVKDAKVFAKDFTVYCYDRRGRVDSGDKKPYSVEREFEDVEALIDAAGGSAILYGHSSGAVIALEAAMRFPSKVKKVAIYDAPYVGAEQDKKEYLVLQKEVSSFIEQSMHARALKCFLMGIGMPKIFVHLIPLMPGWSTMKALAPTLAYDMQLTCDFAPFSRLAGLKAPALIMYGQKSPKVMHNVAAQIAKAVPRAKLQQLDGQDHMINAKLLLPLLSGF